MRTLSVRVTRQHIDAGWKEDCCRCPVALAIAAAYWQRGKLMYVYADYEYLKIEGMGPNRKWSDFMFKFRLPARVVDWMRRFDGCGRRGGRRSSIKPISFTLIDPRLP
jgi:hypothetical protein